MLAVMKYNLWILISVLAGNYVYRPVDYTFKITIWIEMNMSFLHVFKFVLQWGRKSA